jgi:cell division GTPase FtsZ
MSEEINSGAEFDVEVPEIPMPEVVESKDINDDFEAGFKFAFIGSGQGGSRIAAQFWKMGYRRVCCINTAEQDLTHIQLPTSRKFCFGTGGAGKNPAVAHALMLEKKEDVLDFMRRSFGQSLERVFVCVGAGGGTGAGTAVHLVDAAVELQKSLRCATEKVGVIVALPKISEGKKVSVNAYNTLKDLLFLRAKGVVSPLIICDNEKIGKMYPSLAVDPFWDTANASVCSLLHLFNTVSVKHSHYTSFDVNDLKTVFDSGLITLGATPLQKWTDATDISYAVRNNLKNNLLSGGVDLATGSVAGVVIIGGANIMTSVPQTHLDHAFDQLNRMMKPGNTVHRGIYRGSKETLVVYTVVGGLADPVAKLDELRKHGDLPE